MVLEHTLNASLFNIMAYALLDERLLIDDLIKDELDYNNEFFVDEINNLISPGDYIDTEEIREEDLNNLIEETVYSISNGYNTFEIDNDDKDSININVDLEFDKDRFIGGLNRIRENNKTDIER